MYTMEYYTAIESIWVNPKEVMNLQPLFLQSYVSQKEKNKHCILTHIYEI